MTWFQCHDRQRLILRNCCKHLLNQNVGIVNKQSSRLLVEFLVRWEITGYATNVHTHLENEVDVDLRDDRDERNIQSMGSYIAIEVLIKRVKSN